MKLQISFVLLLIPISWAVASAQHPEKAFLNCLMNSDDNIAISSIVVTPTNSTFLSVLNLYIQNSRFLLPEIPKPKVIVTPVKESQVQSAIICGKSSGLEVRVRSGGHDFTGNSYISNVPFFVLDLNNFRSISVDAESRTAWVGAGATLGETYYAIHEKNRSLSFTAGYWPTVGIGGHISGGGYGPLTRQYGLAADKVIDAIVVDVNGSIHDRSSMGEDLFWAIRGGIGSNFAVILSFKLSLVDVPEKVTAFSVFRTLEQNAIELVYKWQHVAPILPLNLTITAQFSSAISNQTGDSTASVTFISVYRGGVDELLAVMGEYLPEFGLTRQDCHELFWIQYFPFYYQQKNLPFLFGYSLDNLEDFFVSRIPPSKPYFKGKGDFVKEPIPREGLQVILNKLSEVPQFIAQMEWTIFKGGVMDEISESEIPFPHRGYLIFMYEVVYWHENDNSATIQERIDFLRDLHDHVIGKYVPCCPRPAYADYRDIDLGVNNVEGPTSIEQARNTWGGSYFNDNFDRLVRVKTQVDPQNYFKNEQSFPILPLHSSNINNFIACDAGDRATNSFGYCHAQCHSMNNGTVKWD